MLRVSRLTDYATLLMTRLAAEPEAILSTSQLAEGARLEMPTVSKLLKMLTHAGLVESFRGARGGYRLARDGARISVADIVEAVEGPIGMTDCGVSGGVCDRESHCGVRHNWQRINASVDALLRGVSVADMLGPPQAVAAMRRRGTPGGVAVPIAAVTRS